MSKLSAAIEAGGTKWICAIGDSDGDIKEEVIIETTTPSETINQVITAFNKLKDDYGSIESIGIGSFGPISVNPSSPDYGTFLNTPKEGWSDFNLITPLRNALGNDIKIYLDTDVNTAVYAEAKIGAGKGLDNVCYVTVGTGIGGGVYLHGSIVKGRMHPEIGHITVEESTNEPQPSFSSCPFHTNCIEGKASGTAMKQRWKKNPDEFTEEAWTLEAFYLAQLARTITATYSPDRIVFGGGVSNHKGLIPLIREAFAEQAGGYWILPDLEEYIKVTALNDRAGLIGALLLAP